MRRGKRLVVDAYIAATNGRNEFGRAVVLRTQPFVSSSSDVLQAYLQCNSDLQFMDRAIPDMDEEEAVTETERGPARPQTTTLILYGAGPLTPLQARMLHSYKVGIKANHICDFYMTKYHAKTQQTLCSALPWFNQAIRRCEAEEQEAVELGAAAPVPLADKVLKRLRRLSFAANRCHWFSATELAVFVPSRLVDIGFRPQLVSACGSVPF